MDISDWTGIETHALQQASGLSAEEFAGEIQVSTTIVYRWRRAGPRAQLRKSSQRQLALLYGRLDQRQRKVFEDAHVAEWERWRGPGGLLITSSLAAVALEGYWVTTYQFGEASHCHADLARITPTAPRRLTAKNYPPEPRSQGRKMGFRNEIEAELFDRQLIGRWRNVSDNYYFGALHLVTMPGEDVLEGVYTGFSHDSTCPAARAWKWVRIDETSVAGLDLGELVIQDPQTVYARLREHSYADGTLPLSDVVEA